MADEIRWNAKAVELDPGVLGAPYDVLTNWHVVAGAQSCGKTTLIERLASLGFETAPEGARRFLEEEMARGRTADEICDSLDACQRGIVDTQLRIESALRPADSVFLDTALPNCLAWWRLCGLDPNEILPMCFRHRYASVFILERLPVELDGLRPKGDAAATFVDEWLRRDYGALGYGVVTVPALPLDERVAFVLERLGPGLV